MQKLEAIKKAYGEYFTQCKPDKNGWSTYDSWFKYIGNKIDYEYSDNKIMNIRPKSISGIDNNNGWIKINTESDLPEQGGEYIVFRMSKKSTATYCKSDRWIVPENDYPKTTFQHGITHYRKKEIIPNPIY